METNTQKTEKNYNKYQEIGNQRTKIQKKHKKNTNCEKKPRNRKIEKKIIETKEPKKILQKSKQTKKPNK